MIGQLKAGDSLIAFFVLRKKELKTKKESDENYLSMELGDASGRISATVWDDVQAHFDAMELGDIVKVKGKVINYKDRLHLTVQNIRRAEEKDEVDLRELVPVVDKDR
ncbi:MAG: OB-fold nucleic acid binding domain-containing protein, partial [bacterium]